MRVRNLQGFEDALDAAVLAALAVERVEAGVRPKLGKARGDVAVHIDAGDAIAGLFKGARAGRARVQRNFALRGPAAHQNRNVVVFVRHIPASPFYA